MTDDKWIWEWKYGGRGQGKDDAVVQAMVIEALAGGRPVVVSSDRLAAERLMDRVHRKLLSLQPFVGTVVD